MLATSELHSVARELATCTDGLVVGDLYFDGADVYSAMADADKSEVIELIRHARGITTPVLELACGSGRLCIPLLAAGHHVLGVDNAPAMLDLLEQRVTNPTHKRRLRTQLADMASFDLDEQFDLIYCGITSIGLLPASARPAMFAAARRHLTAEGRFVFTLFHADGSGVEENSFVSVVEVAGQRDLVIYLERVDYVAEVRTITLVHEPRGPKHQRAHYTSELSLIRPQQVIDECQAAGLSVVGVADKKLGDRWSTEIVCQKEATS